MIFSVTAQTLTPIGKMAELNATYGVYSTLIKTRSEEDAIRRAIEEIATDYEDDAEYKAYTKTDPPCVSILNHEGHIVNHYWGFRSHEV